MKFLVLCCVFLMSPMAAFAQEPQEIIEPISIKIFIGIDPIHPISRERMVRVAAELAHDLEQNIALLSVTYSEPTVLPWSMFLSDREQARMLQKQYGTYDLYVLFSNREGNCETIKPILFLDCRWFGSEILGVAAIEKRIAYVFNFDMNAILHHTSGVSWQLGTSRHEIGHLIGVRHSSDKESFMFGTSGESNGKWTSFDSWIFRLQLEDFVAKRKKR